MIMDLRLVFRIPDTGLIIDGVLNRGVSKILTFVGTIWVNTNLVSRTTLLDDSLSL